MNHSASVGGPLDAVIRGGDGLAAEVRRIPRGRGIHLLNYRLDRSARHTGIDLAGRAKAAIRLDPWTRQPRRLRLAFRDGRTLVRVGTVDRYAAIAVEMTSGSASQSPILKD